MPVASSQALIIERLELLKYDVKDVGVSMKDIAAALTDYQLEHEKRHGTLMEHTNINSRRIEILEIGNTKLSTTVEALTSRVIELEALVDKMYSSLRIVSKVFYSLLVSFLVALMGFGWALITHKISIIFAP